jgi:hypothetical protein
MENKKKRGRKPKNQLITDDPEPDENVLLSEKKKRGRKKKYEIENFEKIINRNEINNFNHSVIYSDDDESSKCEDTSVKNISFGNLNITVSKKIPCPDDQFVLRFDNEVTNSNIINGNTINIHEFSSDEETEVPIEHFTVCEKNYTEQKQYIPKVISECKEKETRSFKNLKVITTIKNLHFVDTLPEKTDICCWWCCHRFDDCPCTLPVQRGKKDTFDCIGIFCSWNCTKAYHYYTVDYKKKNTSMDLIHSLLQSAYGVNKSLSIKPAPPRQCLDIFGGYMSISEFRKNNTCNYRLNLVKSNFIFPEIMEINTVKVKHQETKNLRLSRPGFI